jgi:hypothetical protein
VSFTSEDVWSSFNSRKTGRAQIRLGLSNALNAWSGRQWVVCPFGDEQFLGALKGAQGFGLGVPVNGVEDPVFQPCFDMMCFSRAGLLAAWQRRRVTLHMMAVPAVEMEAFNTATNGTICDRSDQLSS